MSFMADGTLLPRAPQPEGQHEQWAGRRNEKRATWLAPVNDANVPPKVWSGEFDVERRPSWMNRNSDQFEEKEFDDLSEKDEPFTVAWEESDAENPLNFSKGKKWMNAMVLAFAVFMVSIASSGFSQGRLMCHSNCILS